MVFDLESEVQWFNTHWELLLLDFFSCNKTCDANIVIIAILVDFWKEKLYYTAASDLIYLFQCLPGLMNRIDVTVVQIGWLELILDPFIQHK